MTKKSPPLEFTIPKPSEAETSIASPSDEPSAADAAPPGAFVSSRAALPALLVRLEDDEESEHRVQAFISDVQALTRDAQGAAFNTVGGAFNTVGGLWFDDVIKVGSIFCECGRTTPAHCVRFSKKDSKFGPLCPLCNGWMVRKPNFFSHDPQHCPAPEQLPGTLPPYNSEESSAGGLFVSGPMLMCTMDHRAGSPPAAGVVGGGPRRPAAPQQRTVKNLIVNGDGIVDEEEVFGVVGGPIVPIIVDEDEVFVFGVVGGPIVPICGGCFADGTLSDSSTDLRGLLQHLPDSSGAPGLDEEQTLVVTMSPPRGGRVGGEPSRVGAGVLHQGGNRRDDGRTPVVVLGGVEQTLVTTR